MAKKNTTSFKPGQSGNPKGRPPIGDTIAEALRIVMTPTRRMKLARKAQKLAEQGDINATSAHRGGLFAMSKQGKESQVCNLAR